MISLLCFSRYFSHLQPHTYTLSGKMKVSLKMTNTYLCWYIPWYPFYVLFASVSLIYHLSWSWVGWVSRSFSLFPFSFRAKWNSYIYLEWKMKVYSQIENIHIFYLYFLYYMKNRYIINKLWRICDTMEYVSWFSISCSCSICVLLKRK